MLAKIAKFFKVIIPALVLGVGFSYLISFAQIPPPPQNNPFPPINTTATDQIKQFANGVGFLGLDYLKDPAPPTTNWGKKAGPSTLCSDPSGKIIICRVYTPPSAYISVDRAIPSGQAGYNVDEEKPGAGVIREFGMTNDVNLTWSVTKNTNPIDIDPTKSILFAKSPVGASVSPTQVTATGLNQSGSIDNVSTYSAQNTPSTFTISAYDEQGISGGPTLATASAGVAWYNKYYCGVSPENFFCFTNDSNNPECDNNPPQNFYPTTFAFNYTNLPSVFNMKTEKLSLNLPSSCTFSQVNNEFIYLLVPSGFSVPSTIDVTIGGSTQTINVNSTPDSSNLGSISNYRKRQVNFTNKFGYFPSPNNYVLYRSPYKVTGTSVVIQP